MSEKTNIAWCDSTWNFGYGCERVSPGCAHCYITSTPPLRIRHYKHGQPFIPCGEDNWKLPLRLNKKPWVCEKCGGSFACRPSGGSCQDVFPSQLGKIPIMATCNGRIHRRRIFVGSLTDLLWGGVPVPALARVLDTIHQCQDVDFLMLTKRPELWGQSMIAASLHAAGYVDGQEGNKPTAEPNKPLSDWLWAWWHENNPPANVWVGATCEDQQRADERIPELLKIPAKVRFLSCEPLLEGDIDLSLNHISYNPTHTPTITHSVDWVIVGGESGPKFRPMDLAWLESIADQCSAAKVPLFVKQDSGPKPGMQGRIPDRLWDRKEFPEVVTYANK